MCFNYCYFLSAVDYEPRENPLSVTPAAEIGWRGCLHIGIIDDDIPESDENFEVVLSTNTPLAMAGHSRSSITIIDDDHGQSYHNAYTFSKKSIAYDCIYNSSGKKLLAKYIEWNLEIMVTLGPAILSFIERLSSLQRLKCTKCVLIRGFASPLSEVLL